MEFERDPEKSAANLAKHGIDFASARAIWEDGEAVEVRSDRPPETRFMTVGRIGGLHWSAIWTEREGRVRIISVRRSRDSERRLYEGP